jgi:formamidopyrimidine-DNA glycosylase
MPELPDVEIFKQKILSTSLNRTIEEVRVPEPALLEEPEAEFRSHVEGSQIREAGRRGKYLTLKLDKKNWLILHFGLTGELIYCGPYEKVSGFDRLFFRLGKDALVYRAPRVLGKVWRVEDPAAFFHKKKLGPDALEADTRTFQERFAPYAKSRKSVKALLMSQDIVCGIGNAYSDEILFQGRLHPKTQGVQLGAAGFGKLEDATRKVLETAIRNEADRSTLPKNYLLPSRRKGAACPRCKTKIKTAAFAGRESYFCPACQKER